MYNRKLVRGNTLKRKRKGHPGDPPYPWADVLDVITAPPAPDGTEYVAVLCEGTGEHQGQRFIWRTYFTPNRYGNLAFGQFGPQAPLVIDKWIAEEIDKRGWYKSIVG